MTCLCYCIYLFMEIIANFVALEGCDGSGTTTQLSMLKKRLEEYKKPLFFPTYEPTGGPTGGLIRSALRKEITLDPKTLCFLFAADRNEHLNGKEGVLARAKRGELVVSDRYVLSSLVYQGIECGDDLPNLLNARFPYPELTIYLDIKPRAAIERMKNRSSLEIYEYLEFQEKVNVKYMSALKAYGKKARVSIIDAAKSAEEVADKVWSEIREMPIFNS